MPDSTDDVQAEPDLVLEDGAEPAPLLETGRRPHRCVAIDPESDDKVIVAGPWTWNGHSPDTEPTIEPGLQLVLERDALDAGYTYPEDHVPERR